jgi:hypothetical protein
VNATLCSVWFLSSSFGGTFLNTFGPAITMFVCVHDPFSSVSRNDPAKLPFSSVVLDSAYSDNTALEYCESSLYFSS